MSPPDSPYRGLADAGCPGHKDRLQCVAFGGFDLLIRARFRRPIEGIRPLREASFSIPPRHFLAPSDE